MTLIERLVRLAELWAATNERSISRLATIVANDGKLFDRLSEGRSCTVALLERFLDFFEQPSNWGGQVPDEAASLVSSVRGECPAHEQALAS